MFEATELPLRILADGRPPAVAEKVHLLAQTEPNQQSVFVVGRAPIARGQARKLPISNCTPKSGYIGAAAYHQTMIESSIPAGAIEAGPMEPAAILSLKSSTSYCFSRPCSQ